jgi:hypothetical protein
MKRLLAATFAVSLILGGGAALADQAYGTVKEVDSEAHEVVLQNGHHFHFPDTVDLSEIMAGEDVRIRYTVVDGRSEATEIEIHFDH